MTKKVVIIGTGLVSLDHLLQSVTDLKMLEKHEIPMITVDSIDDNESPTTSTRGRHKVPQDVTGFFSRKRA